MNRQRMWGVVAASMAMPMMMLVGTEPASAQIPKGTVHGWGFDGLNDVVVHAGKIFAENNGLSGPSGKVSAASIVELTPSDGSLVKEFLDPSLGMYGPRALAFFGNEMLVANFSNSSVSEITVTSGALTKRFTHTTFGIGHPERIIVQGTDAWVLNGIDTTTVVELDLTKGTLVQTLHDGTPGVSGASDIATFGTELLVLNRNSDDLREFAIGAGGHNRLVSFAGEFTFPTEVVVADGHVFVSTQNGTARTDEINPLTGAIVREAPRYSTHLTYTGSIFADGSTLYVGNLYMGGVTKYSAKNLDLEGTIPSSVFAGNTPVAFALDGSTLVTATTHTAIVEVSLPSDSKLHHFSGSVDHYRTPAAVTVSGGHLFAANENTTSVSESTATSGVPIKMFSGSPYSFKRPSEMASTGGDVFVSSPVMYHIVELDASTGAFVRNLKTLGGPLAMTAGGGHFYVVVDHGDQIDVFNGSKSTPTARIRTHLTGAPTKNDITIAKAGTDFIAGTCNGSGSVVEYTDAGSVVRTFKGPTDGFACPAALASSGSDMFVASTATKVIEINLSTGTQIRVLTGPTFAFAGADAMIVAGGLLYVANGEGASVTGISVSSGKRLVILSGPPFSFDGPDAMAATGTKFYVANAGGQSVTTITA